jgi:putative peptide zinc metalloprotease protein
MVVRRRLAESEGNAAAVQALAVQVEAVDEQIHRADEQLSHLNIRAPLAGTWIAPDIDRRVGGYLKRGEMAGMVASSDEVLIRATAEQEASLAEAGRNVQIRVRGQPENVIEGVVREILPAGQEQLPSAALGYAAGGSIQTAPDDRKGTKAAERFFEIRISPVSSARLLSGQRVVVRLETPPTPLMRQWWRSLLQLFQRRYQM